MTQATTGPADSYARRIDSLIDTLEYRVCRNAAEYEAICRLRYDAYLAEGSIAASDAGTLADAFDTSSNAVLFGVWREGELAASIRLHLASPRDPVSPALSAFPDHLATVLGRGQAFIDPSRFVVDAGIGRETPGLHLGVLRLPFIAAGHLGADFVTATVRQEHEAFYRRVLNCSRVCPPRPYPTLLKPLGLMMVDYAEQAPRVLTRYPFFASRKGEEHLFARLAPHGAGMASA